MDSQDLFDESKLQPAPDEFDPAADLGDLMAQAAQNPAYRPEFLRRLLFSPLLVLVQEEPGPDDVRGEYVGFSPLLLGNGKVPVFTSLARLHDNPALLDYKHVTVKGRDLLEAMRECDLCFNPFSTASIMLPATFCQQLVDTDGSGVGPVRTVEEEREMLVGEPDEYPTAAVDAVRLLLSGQPRVRVAYLLYILASEARPAHFMISMAIEGEAKAIAQQVAQVVLSFQAELGNSFVMHHFRPEEDAFSQYVLETTTPFYERG